MDENLTTAGEPTIVESTVTPTDTGVVATNTDVADGSQVIETPTQMDNNVTYNNIDITNNVTDPTVTNPTEPTNDIIINTDKPLVDNVYDNIITHEHDTNLVENSGSAMQNFFLKDYDYDVDEVGSYWVGGAMNDVKNQMSFLNVLINEEMYDALDLQKYYFDNNLATARAYAAKKDKETAYNYYRAAQEKAIAEGELTGWYMPAEGRYMLGQYTVAMNILENPDASQEERDKADRIRSTVEDWFGANKISTKGIKCLGMMNYEETVRHNKVTERLQKQANAASASAASAQLAATLWDIAELELVWRTDLDENGTIGYTKAQRDSAHSDLFHYMNEHEAWQGRYKWSETRDVAWSDGTAETMANRAGVNYKEINQRYTKEIQSVQQGKNLSTYGYIKPETGESLKVGLSADSKNSIKGSDGSLYKFYTEDGNKYYTKVGDTYKQITDPNATLASGKKISEVDEFFSTNDWKDNSGKNIQVGQFKDTTELKNNYSKKVFNGVGSNGKMNKNQRSGLNNALKDGWTIDDGAMETTGSNTSLVLKRNTIDENGKTVTERATINNDGSINTSYDKKDIIDVHIDSNTGEATFTYPEVTNGDNEVSWWNANWDSKKDKMLGSGYEIGTIPAKEVPHDIKNGDTISGAKFKAGQIITNEIKQGYNKLLDKDVKLSVQWNSDGTPVYSAKIGNEYYFVPQEIAEEFGVLDSSLYDNWNDVVNEHSALQNGEDWVKEPAILNGETETENVKDTAKKVSGGGGAAIQHILDSMRADGSSYTGYDVNNTEMSYDELSTQNVLAYGKEEEESREAEKNKTNINKVKIKEDEEVK